MKSGLLVLLLCLAMSASARERPRPSPYEPLESNDAGEEAAPKPAPLEPRATQINHCLDARGRIVLQDLPCGPTVPRAASVVDASVEVVDLSQLEKRPLREPAAREPRDAENRFTQGLVSGAWKLGLLLLVCWGLYWTFGTVRSWFRYRQLQAEIEAESVRYARSPVRPSRR